MQIKNKIVLITGAAHGLGLAYAREHLRNGASHVAILDLEHSSGEESAEKLNAEFGKGRTTFIPCDVSKSQELENAFKNVVETFGSLDIVINNAGIVNESAYDEMINVNVNAVVRGTLLGLQYMGKDRGGKGGVIVNVASIFGLQPNDIIPIYTATKHAVIGLSRSFANPYHYDKTGVRVLTMCPGVTDMKLPLEAQTFSTENLNVEHLVEHFSELPSQRAENVAYGMIYIITTALNGSIWISEGSEPIYEVTIPDRLTLRVANEY